MAGRGKGGKGIGKKTIRSESDSDEEGNKRTRRMDEESEEESDVDDHEACTEKDVECPENDVELQQLMVQHALSHPDFVIAKKTFLRVANDNAWLTKIRQKEPEKDDGSIVNRNIHLLWKAGRFVKVNEKNPPVYRLSG